MNAAADAMGGILRRYITREPNMDEALAIEWVLDAAQQWVDGKLPWFEAAKIGAISSRNWRTGKDLDSTAYARFLAVVFTPDTDPRRAALLALVDELIDQSGAVPTTQGLFDREILNEYRVTVRSAA